MTELKIVCITVEEPRATLGTSSSRSLNDFTPFLSKKRDVRLSTLYTIISNILFLESLSFQEMKTIKITGHCTKVRDRA